MLEVIIPVSAPSPSHLSSMAFFTSSWSAEIRAILHVTLLATNGLGTLLLQALHLIVKLSCKFSIFIVEFPHSILRYPIIPLYSRGQHCELR